MNLLKVIVITAFTLTASAKCMIKYERTACKGMEKDSYLKCDGNKVCEKSKRVNSETECKKEAVKACKNSRLTETKSKVITATWKGAEIKSDSGNSDFCTDFADRATQFNQCE